MSLLLGIIAQTGGGQASTPSIPVPILIVFGGESNSGGLAPNASASAPELAARSSVQILDNTGLASFEDLNIGTNNLTGHAGLEYAAATAHGWELQIANRVEAGDFNRAQIYLVKAGQGGTVINDWTEGNLYNGTMDSYPTFIDRVTAAVSLIEADTGQTPGVILFWTLGINDANVGTNTTTWKAAQKAVFESIRTDLSLPDLPIIVLNFQSISGAPVTNFITKVNELGSEMDDVHTVDSTGGTTIDGLHWNYASMKTLADAMIDTVLSNYSI